MSERPHGLSHEQAVAAARFLARKRFPYFGSGLMAMIPVPVEGMQERHKRDLIITKQAHILYDPKSIEQMELDDIEFSLLNAMSHILRNTAKIVESNRWRHDLAGKAADAAINDDLMAAGLKPRPSDMLPSKIQDPNTMKPMEDGKTMHEYYGALLAMPQPPGSPDGSRLGNGAGGSGAGNPAPNEKEDSPGSGQGQGQSGNGQGGGQSSPGQADLQGRSEADLERVRKQVAKDLQDHVAKGNGSLPGGWGVWADQQIAPPKVRWQDKLARNIRGEISNRQGHQDFSYARPSRRQSALGYGHGSPILASMVSPEVTVTAAVDTSGSMSQQDLNRAVAELGGILKQVDATVHMMSCDSEVHGKPILVKNLQDAAKKLKGGGGTNLSPVVEAALELKSEILVILTDGGGPIVDKPPLGMKVILVLIGAKNGGWAGAQMPWSDVTGDPITWCKDVIWVEHD